MGMTGVEEGGIGVAVVVGVKEGGRVADAALEGTTGSITTVGTGLVLEQLTTQSMNKRNVMKKPAFFWMRLAFIQPPSKVMSTKSFN
jgi:hypothetical protein